MGIEVRLGARKRYMGIVWRLYDRPPGFATKTAGRLMGDAPLLTPAQMELWEWMAEYYMCTLGDVMRFAMPAALKPAGLTEEEFRRVEYRPATVRYVKLGPSVADAQALHTALEGLHRAKGTAGRAARLLCSVSRRRRRRRGTASFGSPRRRPSS